MFRILNALNKACYEYGYLHSVPFSEKRDIVVDRYVYRRNMLNRLEIKFRNILKRG